MQKHRSASGVFNIRNYEYSADILRYGQSFEKRLYYHGIVEKNKLLRVKMFLSNVEVSVIVPVLNTRDYIQECLDSIRKQTLESIEVICVDGGSTDGTLDIINDYVKSDNRFLLVTDTKGSYGAQVNRGFELAKGRYLAIAEPDDYVSVTMYEDLFGEAIDSQADIVRSDYCRFIGEPNERFFFQKSACDKKWYYKDLNSYEEKDLLENTPANWSGIYKRSFLENNRILHNTTKGAAYQDLGFWFLTFTLAKKIRFIPTTGYYYRIDNPNSSINAKDKSECLKAELSWLKEQLIERKLYDEYRDKYLRIEMIHTGWMKRKTEGIKKSECFKRITNSRNDSCFLFGCGADGVDYLMTLKKEGLLSKISYLTDNDSTLWGKKMLGISVLSPDDVLEKSKTTYKNEYLFIISTTRYAEIIANQLVNGGIKVENILRIDN